MEVRGGLKLRTEKAADLVQLFGEVVIRELVFGGSRRNRAHLKQVRRTRLVDSELDVQGIQVREPLEFLCQGKAAIDVG